MRLLEASPLKHSAISLDLLNLNVVNQISTKKSNPGKVKKPVHVDINQVPGRWRRIELPKTPEPKPPKLFLDDVQNRELLWKNTSSWCLSDKVSLTLEKADSRHSSKPNMDVVPECLAHGTSRLQKEVLENRQKYLAEKEKSLFESANIVREESWLSKAACKQKNFSDPEADKPLCFQQVNSPEYSYSFGKSPKVIADKDFKNCNREEPLFGIIHERETMNVTEDNQPALLFEEENHQFPTTPSSESCHSFFNNNVRNKLFSDSIYVNQTSSIYGPYSVKEMPQISSCTKICPAERNLESIFTTHEQICSQNTKSFSTLDQKPIKNHLNDYCIQDRNPLMLSELQEDTSDTESAGRLISQHQKIKIAATMQNYLKKNMKGVLAEPNLNHLHIFGMEEIDKEICCNQTQSPLPTRENDDESQLSSQSPGYSPEQTEQSVGMTSDESAGEDHDGNISTCYEDCIPRNDGNPLAVLGNPKSQCHCHSEGMPFIFHDSVTRDKANIHPQVKPNTNPRKYDIVLPQQTTLHESFKKNQVNFKAMHSTWSQTEKCIWETSDAAVQCDILQACSCKKEVSSVLSAEIVTSTSKIDTTGGQNIPADRAVFQPSVVQY